VDKLMTFAAKDGTYFWSNGYAWGSCSVKQSNKGRLVDLAVLQGELDLSSFTLSGFGQVRFEDILKIKAGEKVTFTVSRDSRSS
jgi:non-lysosomal glucosylceramidase